MTRFRARIAIQSALYEPVQISKSSRVLVFDSHGVSVLCEHEFGLGPGLLLTCIYFYLCVINCNKHQYLSCQNNISNIILMKRMHVRIHIIMINKHFNIFFISTTYCFVMSSACNTVVLVKSFKTAIYMPKTEVG